MTQVKIFENIKIKPLGISPSGDIKVMVIYDKPDEKEQAELKANMDEIRNTLYNYSKAHRGVNAYV